MIPMDPLVIIMVSVLGAIALLAFLMFGAPLAKAYAFDLEMSQATKQAQMLKHSTALLGNAQELQDNTSEKEVS